MTVKPSYEKLERRIQELQKTESELKQIKGVLLESEEGYRTLIQFSPLPFLVTQEERIIVVNPAALNFFGIKDEGEIIGTSPGRWIHPDFIDLSYQRRCQVLENGGLAEIKELILIRKDAQEMAVLANTVRITHNGSPATLSVFQDITELKKIQGKLIESETLFRGMFNNHSAVMLLIDPNTGQIIKANQAATKYYGYSLEKMLQMKIQQFNNLSPAEIMEKMGGACNKQVNIFEFQHMLADGQVRDVEVHSAPITIQHQILLFSIIHDITERKRAENALRESAGRLRQAHQMAKLGHWDWKMSSGELSWSDEVYAIFGRDKYNFQPSTESFETCIHPDDYQDFLNEREAAIAENRPVDIEHRIKLPDGNIRYVQELAEIFKDNDGNIVRVSGTVQDITDHKRAEDALLRNEKDLRESQRIAHVGSWRLDVSTNQVVWTEELYNMYGFDPSLPPPPYTEHMKLFTPESWERLSTALARTREIGIPYTLELETVRKDGSNGWMWVRGEANVDSEGKTVELWGAAQDITDRKQAEQILKESEEKYRRLFDNAVEGVFQTTPDGGFLSANPSLARILGYNSASELIEQLQDIGKQHYLKPEDRETFLRIMETDGGTSDFEVQLLKQDGSRIWASIKARAIRDETGNIHHFDGFLEDITERKRAEEILRESEKKIRATLDATPFPIAVVDLQDDKIFFWSRSAVELFGHTASIASEWYQMAYPDPDYRQVVIEEWKPVLEKARKSGQTVNAGERRITCKDRSECICEIYATFLPDNLIITFSDITERKKAEVEREKLQAQLNQAQKMESIGTLAGGIAHDFNNILFPIVGYAEMLLEDVPEDSPLKDSLDNIYTSALRAKDLVKQILTFSRQGSNELMLMRMQPVVKEALKLIRSTIPTTIGIKQDINSDCGVIKADPTQIHQIVMNLATNAYHAMEETGGELKVSLKEMEFGTLDLINPDMVPGVYACLTVADTGKGMDKNLTDKIFDPFFTTKAKGKGTGMGLSVVHGIVKGMGGAIHVYSEPEKGTEFHVYLPVEKSFSETRVTQATIPNKGGTEHILFVDDEEVILQMGKQMLERLGYHVTSRTSSLEALEAFRSNPDKFDLVITDMAMPNMSGIKLSAELIKIRPDIPVLLCTGFSETMSEAKATSLGIKGFLLKPIVMKDLSRKIREVLDKN